MIFKFIYRNLHSTKPCWAVEKSVLAKLRKKTGYTFTHCKNALEMHENDINKAESWLREQAQQLGWARATKLEGRQTTQGLIGVTVRNNCSTLVELNCETDFVAKNEKFQELARIATNTVLSFAEKQRSCGPVTRIGLDIEQLKELNSDEGKSLADHVAMVIGSVGENASLKRALCLKTDPDSGIHVFSYSHPPSLKAETIQLGRLGGLVAIKQTEDKSIDLEDIGKKICQHIVGMNPQKIGTSDDKPMQDIEQETCLIHQEYLLDDSITVGEVLSENGIEVINFSRFECGETDHTEQSLDVVETCH